MVGVLFLAHLNEVGGGGGTLTLSSEFKDFGPKLEHKEHTFCHILIKHHKYTDVSNIEYESLL